MLTRIEIDGFKTFDTFSLDVPAFSVILGANASGKSNFFDAVQLLARLAEHDLRSAISALRGEPLELFRLKPGGEPSDRISLAAEVLLPPNVTDPWGARVDTKHSRVRYEVEIRRRQDKRGFERLVVSRESAVPIGRQADSWYRSSSTAFRKAHLRYTRHVPWLTTERDSGATSFQVRQDGRAGRARPADAAEATVLSSIRSAEFPHLFALGEELRSWRLLQLNPFLLRQPSPITAPTRLQADGSNLAAVLARIEGETRTQSRPHGNLAEIVAELAGLIPSVSHLSIDHDQQKREYRLTLKMGEEPPFSSRVASDGTLRVLALLTFLYDPQYPGPLFFEEPENGIHPLRLKAMISRLRELATSNRAKEVDPSEPLRQIVMNSHSPVVLAALEAGEAVFADTVRSVGQGNIGRRTRMRPVSSAQGSFFGQSGVSKIEVDRILSSAQPDDSASE